MSGQEREAFKRALRRFHRDRGDLGSTRFAGEKFVRFADPHVESMWQGWQLARVTERKSNEQH